MSGIDEENSLIKYEEKLPAETTGKTDAFDEEIKLWTVRKRKPKTIIGIIKSIWSFAALVFAFLAVFVLVLVVVGFQPQENDESEHDNDEAVSAGVENEPNSELSISESDDEHSTPIIINETNYPLELDFTAASGYSLATLFAGFEGVKVAIVHSHNSESISENINVIEAGEALSQILSVAGISCIHSKADHDSQTGFGAYERMKNTVASLKENNSDLVLVIDLHDSDSGVPLLLTVGAEESYAWRENFDLASAVCTRTVGVENALRVIPADIGQNNGLLTLHVGIGNDKALDEEARKALAAFATAIIDICTKAPL